MVILETIQSDLRENPGRYDILDYDNDNDIDGIPKFSCGTRYGTVA